ncbi:transcription factor IIA subunit alpha [Coemansia erecta]|nr:transcription factor IIA subunit alpha [Coemansia erecta]
MSNSIVAAIYRYVIDDVVRNVQPDFEGHGVNNSVLEQLQRSWETKIIQSRVASFPGEEAHAAADYAAGGVGMDYMNAPGDYSPSSADHRANMAAQPNINSAASLAAIMNNDSMAPSAASLASLAQSGRSQLLDDDDDDATAAADGAQDIQGPYARHDAYRDPKQLSRNSRHIPQNDGSADDSSVSRPVDPDNALAQWHALRDSRRRAYRRAMVAQLDGPDDSEDDSPANQPTAPSATVSIAPAETEAQEDLINSDLDDTDEDDYDNGGAEDIEHIILCQYEKVTRTRNRWKCVLRDGIMLINGRDYLFQKATGEFEW